MGAAGLVYDHFAEHSPTIIASKRIRATIKARDNRDPATVHGKNYLASLCAMATIAVRYFSFFWYLYM